ncbi:peptidase inhibitor family I36 protein [Leifsonia sp. WHRI 6310E]|uniref:peptidase inhibitor family I36 protein n=1 Tax=Leifsonia sp. WHRI 6310E TaxID=3162562 RepID=UPI0032EF6D19
MKIRNVIIGSALAVGMVLGGAVAANATPENGGVEVGEVGFYFSPNYANAVWDWNTTTGTFWAGDSFLFPFKFKGSGVGVGSVVRNNAASAWNRGGSTGRVYYSPSYAGVSQSIAQDAAVNLNDSLRNNNASWRWV